MLKEHRKTSHPFYIVFFLASSLLLSAFSQHLLGQTEDLLPSVVTLLMAFPENTQKKTVIFQICIFFFLVYKKLNWKSFPEVCSGARNSECVEYF